MLQRKEGKLQVDNIHVMESPSGLPGLNSVWLTAALAVRRRLIKNQII